jgi:uncharacterized protein (TIGR03435 family)
VLPTPGRVYLEGISLGVLMRIAFGIQEYHLAGTPGWMVSEHYDIDARAPVNTPPEQLNAMIQSLMADRFQLRFHRETRDLPVYTLTAARSGFKLKPAKDGSCIPIERFRDRCRQSTAISFV